MENLLEIKDLKTSFMTGSGEVRAVRGVSFGVGRGEILGVVGESGSGKSVTCMSILKLLATSGRIRSGEIRFDGQDLVPLSAKALRKVRGNRIAMVFQDPMSSLNPLMPIGEQVSEMIWEHNRALSKKERDARVIELFKLVRIPEPEKRLKAYPHEFSGGMRQRVMIAMALSCNPELLIADEPTTALDVTIQDQILKLLRELQEKLHMSIIFITHDLGVVAEICSRVVVLYGGLVMEEAPVDELFERPMHPYTMGLLQSVPGLLQDKNARLQPIPGSPPDMLNPPKGCPFAPRCPFARQICLDQCPPYTQIGENRRSMCWLLDPRAPLGDNPFKGVQND